MEATYINAILYRVECDDALRRSTAVENAAAIRYADLAHHRLR